MLKRFMRWILPLVVLMLIATYFVFSPMVASHAAAPGSSSIHIVAANHFVPKYFRRH